MKKSAYMLIGGGVALGAAAWFASRKTTDAISRAIGGNGDVDPATGQRGVFNARLTGYWPKSATPDERKMEGGLKDRKGQPLHTLEDHLADPGAHPYVSVAGDYDIFPYGQRLVVGAWPKAVFRVVDTGGHFHGASKLYRIAGYEPLDINVDSSTTIVPKTSLVRIVVGDNFESGRAVATGGMKGQNVVVGYAEAEPQIGRTNDDVEALARAIESEAGDMKSDERVVAAWAIRNRADATGVSVFDLLAPRKAFGAPRSSGGFCSTRKAPSVSSRRIASEVIDAATENDPTGGAIDFWVPARQDKMRRLGDAYRDAVANGDELRAQLYARYASYGTEDQVREQYRNEGLYPVRIFGMIELLGRRS